MTTSTPTKWLRFYVVKDVHREKDSEGDACYGNLSLSNAMQLYNYFGQGMYSAIGVDSETGRTDLARRVNGRNTLVTDYLGMDEWKHDPYLCIWAVSQLVVGLDIRQEIDRSGIIRPLREWLHVLRLKDEPALRPCMFMSLETVRKKGVEPTLEHYDLVYTEAMRDGESMVDTCKRYQREAPPAFTGFAPTVSDVLLYQTRMGCHAIYINSFDFDLLDKFVCIPGEAPLPDPLYARNGIKA